ncbi:MAG: hypothetical protein E7Z92_05700 [Cyanobacteria bacterium SIG31]|nr:hypothetical protein [Cyanobacteria bacterium SIG31]
MTGISAVGATTAFAPQPRSPRSQQDINKKELERAVVIAKTKPDDQRTFEDYLALTIDAFQKIMTPPVIYARENTQVNYLA